ncbi:LCP family protein [Streptomyces sp. TR06-5]|uniref:LCP family protein n=1 Tax=unclassified Streptomyces TaxID=2593676 RepID=UPI0039A3B5F4
MRSAVSEHASGGRRRRGRPNWGLRLAVGLAVLVLATSGVGHALVTGLAGDLRRIDPFLGLTDRPKATGHGLNFLVVGIDDRTGLTDRQRRDNRLGGTSCDCTDTLMLVHVSEDRKRLSVVSIPRDSYVKLPPHTDGRTRERHRALPAKINSAYAHGGPHLTVSTVEKATGVHVDHYLEVDFASFMKTVDVLGGIEVCTVRPLQDDYSGLDLPAGTSRLDGGQALSYVRARHVDGGSDFGRMHRQQRFLAALIGKATATGVLTNPVKLSRVTSTLLGSVRADAGFGSDEMMALAQAMRGVSPSSSEFVSVPVADADHRVDGVGSTVRWDRKRASHLFEALRRDRPLTDGSGTKDGTGPGGGGATTGKRSATPVDVPPAQVDVQVLNGTTRTGLAGRTDRALRGTGFRTTGVPRNAERQDVRRTVISYDPRWNRSVRTVAAAFPGARLVKDAGRGPLMEVTLGKRFSAVHPVRAADPFQAAASDGDGKDFEAVTGDEVTCD